jgi:hypothetical protein
VRIYVESPARRRETSAAPAPAVAEALAAPVLAGRA